MTGGMLHVERVRYLLRSPASVLASMAAVLPIAYVGYDVAGGPATSLWVICVAVVGALRVGLWHRARDQRITPANSWIWLTVFSIGLLLSAGLWATPAVLVLNQPVSIEVTALYACALAAIVAGSMFSLASWRRCFLPFVAIAGGLPVVCFLLSEAELARIVGVMGTAYLAAVVAWGLSVCRMVVEAIQLRVENIRLASEVGLAREQADEIDRLRHEGFASLSHELRTPLNAIFGFGQAIEEELWGKVGNERYKEYAHNIVQAGRHLEFLIEEAMDLSRMQSGRVTLEEREFDIGELARDCETLVADRAHGKDLTLRLDVPTGLPRIYGDPIKIRQIVINLLSNAVKFTPTGGRITMTVAIGEDGWLEICVSDTGPGIPADDLQRVMEPFVRGGGVEAHAVEGLGLGLALSRALAELHGGTLELSSRVGEGTNAHLRLPRARLRQ